MRAALKVTPVDPRAKLNYLIRSGWHRDEATPFHCDFNRLIV
jgi:hypothetical protein